MAAIAHGSNRAEKVKIVWCPRTKYEDDEMARGDIE
jgi:hypothetical protein